MIKFIGSIPGFDQGFKNMTIHAFSVEFIAFISKFWYSFLFKFGHIFSEDLLQVNDLQLDRLSLIRVVSLSCASRFRSLSPSESAWLVIYCLWFEVYKVSCCKFAVKKNVRMLLWLIVECIIWNTEWSVYLIVAELLVLVTTNVLSRKPRNICRECTGEYST